MKVTILMFAAALAQATAPTTPPVAKPAQAEPPKPVAEVGRPVSKEIAKAVTLEASAEGNSACARAIIEQNDKLLKHPSWLALPEEKKKQLGVGKPQACIDNEVANLTVGVAVEVSSNPGVCAEPTKTFLRVRVASGKDKGAIGCVSPTDLRDQTPF